MFLGNERHGMGDFILPFFLDWHMYFDNFVVSTHTDRNNLIKIGNLTAFIREGLDLFFNLKTNKNVSTPTPRNILFSSALSWTMLKIDTNQYTINRNSLWVIHH